MPNIKQIMDEYSKKNKDAIEQNIKKCDLFQEEENKI
jgi:hypothetical protein